MLRPIAAGAIVFVSSVLFSSVHFSSADAQLFRARWRCCPAPASYCPAPVTQRAYACCCPTTPQVHAGYPGTTYSYLNNANYGQSSFGFPRAFQVASTQPIQTTALNAPYDVMQPLAQSIPIAGPVNSIATASYNAPAYFGGNQGTLTSMPTSGVMQASYSAPANFMSPMGSASMGSASMRAKSYAVQSAQYRASNRIHGHGIRVPFREGVGWSTVSAQDAISRCCYWQSNIPREYAVFRGPDGWYASAVFLR